MLLRAGSDLGSISLNSYLVSWKKDQACGKFSLLTLLTPQEAWGVCKGCRGPSCYFSWGPHIQQWQSLWVLTEPWDTEDHPWMDWGKLRQRGSKFLQALTVPWISPWSPRSVGNISCRNSSSHHEEQLLMFSWRGTKSPLSQMLKVSREELVWDTESSFCFVFSYKKENGLPKISLLPSFLPVIPRGDSFWVNK